MLRLRSIQDRTLRGQLWVRLLLRLFLSKQQHRQPFGNVVQPTPFVVDLLLPKFTFCFVEGSLGSQILVPQGWLWQLELV